MIPHCSQLLIDSWNIVNNMGKNISGIKNCFGCGVCDLACPKKIIQISPNKNGFYEPRIIDYDKCIHCGLCVDVCAFTHDELADDTHPLKSWGAWSQDELTRLRATSGGVATELCRQLLASGYKIIGCKYNYDTHRAEHAVADNFDDLNQFTGSKYMQSLTSPAFHDINRSDKYVVIGTPCQIDSFRRYINRFKCQDRFILIDFYCHNVCSINAWDAYRDFVSKRIGKIKYVSWRNKTVPSAGGRFIGWHDSYVMVLEGDNGEWVSSMRDNDLYYQLFFGDVCDNPACAKSCKYKYDRSSADIRLGDFWGEKYRSNQNGVNTVVAFTEKGVHLIESLSKVEKEEHPFYEAAGGQMRHNVSPRCLSFLVLYLLRHGVGLDSPLFKLVMLSQRVISKISHIIRK